MKKVKPIKSASSEKGQLEELSALYETLIGESRQWPISLDSLIETTEISFIASNEVNIQMCGISGLVNFDNIKDNDVDTIKLINDKTPIDEHLADNLIPFLGLFGGKIKTNKITNHILSNIYVTELFLECKFKITNNTIEKI